MIKFANEKELVNKMMEAFKGGNEAEAAEAAEAFRDSIMEQMKADFEAVKSSNDSAILAQRGYRQLTAKETAWYNKVIEALKSKTPMQAFLNVIGSDDEDSIMPSTIIEDVYKNLVEEHALLKAVNFQYVGYLTHWLINDNTKQKAVWGAVTAAISEEITSAFKVVDVKQSKLTAYAAIEKGMLDLGPVFLDNYIRTCLKEALANGLEQGIINGNGINQPVGMLKDISADVVINPTTGYPDKEAVAVKSFDAASYGALVSKLAVTEAGTARKLGKVTLICNQVDYLGKVMPASTVMTANGTYAGDVFPIPTDVIVSNELATGTAILCLADEYNVLAGGEQNGVIEYSDEYKFVEDMRYFKIKQYATGRAFDDTSCIKLDISGLEPAYLLVKEVAPTA